MASLKQAPHRRVPMTGKELTTLVFFNTVLPCSTGQGLCGLSVESGL